jgi:hypothetical protein
MKIVFFNIENLFLDNSHRFKSSPHKLKGLKRNIEYMNPDIMFLCEVGGMSTLKIFNEKHLDNAYTPILIEGNSDRGIELACLIKKDFKDEYKVSNYKDRPINFNYSFELMENEQAKHKNKTPPHLSHKFSRDVLQIDLFKKGNEKPYASFLYVHLKSKLDKDGIDPKGINRRKAEFNELLSIYKEIVKKNGDDYPVIVAGDFNGNASKLLTDDEFQSV